MVITVGTLRTTLWCAARFATETAAWAAAVFVTVASLSPWWFGPVVIIHQAKSRVLTRLPPTHANLPPATALGALTLRSTSDAAGWEVSVAR